MKRAYTGTRDRKIEVLRCDSAKNDIGEEIDAQVSVAYFWAHMEDVSGNESLEGKIIHINTRNYTMPYDSSVMAFTEKLIVSDEGKDFNVFHTQEIGRKEQMLLKCTISE